MSDLAHYGVRRQPSLSASVFLLALVGTLLAAAVVAFLLPYDAYTRFQQLDATQEFRARWVYERISFDPTPIDVAIVGPSQSLYGVSARDLERELAARGLPGIRVANLSMIRPGDDLHAEIIRLLVSAKRPRVIIVAVAEQMSQSSHPRFASLFSPQATLRQGFYGNRAYGINLMLAIYTQIQMLRVAVAPHFFGYDASFDSARFRRAAADAAGDERLPDGHVVDHTAQKTRAFLDNDRIEAVRNMHTRVLRGSLEPIQFGVPLRAYRDMAEIARAAGVELVFLYQPIFRGQRNPREHAFYDGLAPTVAARWHMDDPTIFSDALHRNRAGAMIVTAGLASWLAAHERTALADRAATDARIRNLHAS